MIIFRMNQPDRKRVQVTLTSPLSMLPYYISLIHDITTPVIPLIYD